MENSNNRIIVELNGMNGIAIAEVEAPIAEAQVAKGEALEVEISEGMYKAIEALISAYDNNDESMIMVYEGIADNRFTADESATAGYEHYSLDTSKYEDEVA